MKILMSNHSLMHFGGTETWLYEMARRLVEEGHEVTVFTMVRGPFADELQKRVALEIVTLYPVGRTFDAAILNHGTCLGALRTLDCPVVYTQHGPSHRVEQALPGAAHYVAVSEEVKMAMAQRGFYDVHLIRNGVDLDRFHPVPTHNERPVVLSMCKNVMGRDMVGEACARVGYPCRSIQWEDNPTWDISGLMQEADIVVGYGRSCYEALACGKDVLVFDARNKEPRADGFLNPDNLERIVQFNCSGRYHKWAWGVDDLERALRTWQSHHWTPGWQRAWAEDHHDADRVAIAYMGLLAAHTEPHLQLTQ